MQKLRKTIGLATLILLGNLALAQGHKVESVKFRFENPVPEGSLEYYQELDLSLESINAAAKHPKTANDPKMWYYRGLTYLTVTLQGNDEQKAKYPNALEIATKSFYKAIETDEKDKYTEDAKNGLINCAIGHYNNAVAQYKEGKYNQAISSYEQVLKILPYDKDGNLKRNNIVEETITQFMSYAAIAAEDYPQAKKLLQKLIDKNFQDPNIYVEMVRIHLIEKDTANALKYVSMGREMFESNTTLIDVELDLYLKQGRSQELIDKLNKAIEQDPQNKIYYFARAVSNMKLEKLEAAEKDYKKVIELDPLFADAYYNLGVVYIDRCKPIAKQIEESRDFKKQNDLQAKIDEWYKKAGKQFEEALAVGEYSNAEKLDLANTIKKIYARLMQNEPSYKTKYEEMKDLIATLGG